MNPTDEQGTAPAGRAELEAAGRRIAELTEELDATNRGIVALHTELDNLREAEARARAEREVLAERERIADGLRGQIIQRLFSAILSLEGVVGVVRPARAAARLQGVIDDLDGTIGQLRDTIFALHMPERATSLRARLLEVVGEAHAGLGFAPAVSFEGPIDTAVPDHVATHLLAAVAEALSEIGRHARATGAEVELRTADDLVLVVRVSGPGLGGVALAPGLREMRERAEALGGTLRTTSQPAGGTCFEWRVPLP